MVAQATGGGQYPREGGAYPGAAPPLPCSTHPPTPPE